MFPLVSVSPFPLVGLSPADLVAPAEAIHVSGQEGMSLDRLHELMKELGQLCPAPQV